IPVPIASHASLVSFQRATRFMATNEAVNEPPAYVALLWRSIACTVLLKPEPIACQPCGSVMSPCCQRAMRVAVSPSACRNEPPAISSFVPKTPEYLNDFSAYTTPSIESPYGLNAAPSHPTRECPLTPKF